MSTNFTQIPNEFFNISCTLSYYELQLMLLVFKYRNSDKGGLKFSISYIEDALDIKKEKAIELKKSLLSKNLIIIDGDIMLPNMQTILNSTQPILNRRSKVRKNKEKIRKKQKELLIENNKDTSEKPIVASTIIKDSVEPISIVKKQELKLVRLSQEEWDNQNRTNSIVKNSFAESLQYGVEYADL